MLSNIRGKLLLITLLGSMTALFTLALGMYAVRDSIIQERLLTLEQITDVAHGLIEATYSQVEAGEITKDEAMKRLEGQLREMRFEEDGYFFIYDFDGVALIHATKPQLQGKNLIDFKDPAGNFMIRKLVQAAQSPEGRGTVEYLWPRAKGEEPVEKLGHVRAFAPWRMAIGTGIYIDDINSIVLGQVATLGALVLLLCGVGFAFSWRIASGLTRRVHSLNDTMGLLAQGQTSVEIDTQAAGELGEMARSVEVFRRNALEREALEAKQAELKAEAEQQRKAAVQRMAEHLEARIGQVAGEMKRISEQLGVQVARLNDATGRTHDFAQTVSGASQIAASNVEMVAASTQELDASSREINQQMERSAQLAAQAAESAEVAGDHLTALSEATQNVDSITHVISEVAEQTSLLALNATIEAARAGEAGKGFAVVADEVKGLAGQTKSAVDEIGAQIAATQQTAQRTVSSVGEISSHIYDVRDASNAVAAAVTEQGSAISEITRNIEAVSAATHSINDTIQRLVDEMSQSQIAVKDVEQVSGGVREVADHLEQAVLSVVQELRGSL